MLAIPFSLAILPFLNVCYKAMVKKKYKIIYSSNTKFAFFFDSREFILKYSMLGGEKRGARRKVELFLKNDSLLMRALCLRIYLTRYVYTCTVCKIESDFEAT
jgi:hypothetical protein